MSLIIYVGKEKKQRGESITRNKWNQRGLEWPSCVNLIIQLTGSKVVQTMMMKQNTRLPL